MGNSKTCITDDWEGFAYRWLARNIRVPFQEENTYADGSYDFKLKPIAVSLLRGVFDLSTDDWEYTLERIRRRSFVYVREQTEDRRRTLVGKALEASPSPLFASKSWYTPIDVDFELVVPSEARGTRPESVVYFIRSEQGPIKIGFTKKSAESRLKSLQTGNHHALELVAFQRGTQADEKALHKRFAHLRLSGEWFTPAADLLAFIAELPR